MKRLLVAIDGPAGSGKSTVARAVARKLGVPVVDTGAMYRALTLAALRRGVLVSDEEALARLAGQVDIGMESGGVRVDGEDVTEAIRGPEVTRAVSEVSAHPRVREKLVERQRQLAGEAAVVEGRDIGTVVLPDATAKIYLVAQPEERARRRFSEVGEGSYDDALDDISERDRKDSGRAASPLRVAADAIVLDTTGMTVDEVVQRIMHHLEEVRG